MNYTEYIIPNITLVILDFIWLGLYMANRYKDMVMDLQGEEMQVRFPSAFLAYTLMAIGLSLFVIPNIRSGTILQDSLLYGMTFGVIVYGIYDLTAHAVLKKWDPELAVYDVIWGVVSSTSAQPLWQV
jgi:uncharacterized membrane protein